MAGRKSNRRSEKTKRAVFTALAELMCEKELREITVQELSDRADIHRVTFYKHFMDIYDVYEQLEKNILTEVGGLVTRSDDKPLSEVYSDLFGFIVNNPTYFKMIFSPHNTNTLYQKMMKLIMGFNRFVWSESLGLDMTDVRVDNAIRYHCNGAFSIVGNWVQCDFDQPQEDIVKMLAWLEKRTRTYLTELLNNKI